MLMSSFPRLPLDIPLITGWVTFVTFASCMALGWDDLILFEETDDRAPFFTEAPGLFLLVFDD